MVPAHLSDPSTAKIFAHVFDLYGLLDFNGRVLEMGGSIFDRASAEPKNLDGQIFAETAFWQSSETTSRAVTAAVKSSLDGNIVKLNVDFRVNAREKIPVDLTFVPTEKCETVFVCAVARKQIGSDNNEQTDAAAQLLIAAESADIGLWYWNFGETQIRSTAMCKAILGLQPTDELSYDTFLEAVHFDDRASVAEFMSTSIRSGERYENRFRIISPEGNLEWVAAEGKSFLSSDGKPERMLGIVRRITEEKEASEELETVYEREKAARDEAEEANRSKDIFLAFVSHELRAPLNAILGWANILLTKDVDEKTRRNAVETIERSARMQTKLINDLVDSARVASGKIRLEYRPTDLFGIVRNAVEAQRPAAEARGLEYRITSEPIKAFVMGDANRLQQVFGNLLSNAIKFTTAGGAVSVNVSLVDSQANVTITDSGEGISADTLPNIFRQFSQVGTAEKKGVGLGLGLSIVKTLVEKHGGTVVAESDGIGSGSRFIVTLPTLDAENIDTREKRQQRTDAQQPLAGVLILIVEDENDSREVLRLFLENQGAKVLQADSAAAAGELLFASGHRPNLIISDIGMPNEDGISFIKRVRESGKNDLIATPAIALSAFATNEIKKNAIEAGFHKYLAKPFDPETLTREILEQLSSRN